MHSMKISGTALNISENISQKMLENHLGSETALEKSCNSQKILGNSRKIAETAFRKSQKCLKISEPSRETWKNELKCETAGNGIFWLLTS